MHLSKPLNRKLAIPLALAGMWILAHAGVFLLVHSDRWLFIGDKATTIVQIIMFYVTWTAVQVPAASIAGMVLVSSDFIHPLRTTFWTMAAYALFVSTITAFHWPWTAMPELDQSIPVAAHLISTLLLIGASVFFAWLLPRWNKVFQRHFRH
jgi:hypothetical protein